MKRILFMFALVAFAGFSMNAQCTQSKTANAKASQQVCSVKAAAQAASLDANIEKKVCAKSGKVSYQSKSVCETSGKVSYKDVKYCTSSNKFVNVAPQAVGEKKACSKATSGKTCSKSAAAAKTVSNDSKKECSKKCAKTCSKSAAAAKTVSNDSKKACTAATAGKTCSKATAGKSCCASKAKTAKAAVAPERAAKPKMVKAEE